MANSSAFIDHVVELAGIAGRAEARPMFGGHGLYVDGLIVGLVVDDMLYLKSDDQTLEAFEARQLPAFEYAGRGGRRTVMSYHLAPDEVLDQPDAMREWLGLAREAALRTAAAKRARGQRR
jgi:DNA transformation protein